MKNIITFHNMKLQENLSQEFAEMTQMMTLSFSIFYVK